MKSILNSSKTIFSIGIFSFVFVLFGSSQDEQLLPLKNNFILKNYWVQKSAATGFSSYKLQAAGDTLKIPFVDDFSYQGIFPSSDLWTDSNVFVNATFPINPPTVGVATFDGLDMFGNAYDNSSPNNAGVCDYLTSKPINLADDDQGNPYQLSDSIWLSFYVQRKGKGNATETTDSLVVDFFDPVPYTWEYVWSLKGGPQDTAFQRITIKITDAKWLYKGFRFRFRNFGSQTGNIDHWHIDYVILRRTFAPYDNNIDDVAWAYNYPSLLKNFTALPWNHYKTLAVADKQNLMRDTIKLTYTNVNSNPANVRQVSNNDAIFDENGNQLQSTPGSNTINLDPGDYVIYNFPLNNFYFPDTVPVVGDASIFEVINRLSTTPDANRINDTLHHHQIFKSYYAYDDGTCEAGYTVLNQINGKIALRFEFLQPDTIRGVQIFFSQLADNSTNNLFRLTIWSQLTPTETIIYQQSGLTPNYVDTINGFANYMITDTNLVLPANVPIYIGIIQSSGNTYNLGFDVNLNNNSRMFYSALAGWQNSQIPGTFMIRPLFGDSVLVTGVASHPISKGSLEVSPNPFNTQFQVTANGFDDNNEIEYSVIDAFGKCICNKKVQSSADATFVVDLTDSASGIYLLVVRNTDIMVSKKMIKN